MEAKNTFSILFYPKTSDSDKHGMSPLFLRITVDSKRVELSLKRKVRPKNWCPISNRVIGKGQNTDEINNHLDDLKVRIRRIQAEFVSQGQPYSAVTVKDKLLNKGSKIKTVLSIYDNHNNNMQSLLGVDYTYSTYRRHVRTRNHLERFIFQEYGGKDLFITNVNLKFVTGFEHYLKLSKAGSHNTIVKYVTNFKKIVRIALANNWMKTDPFYHWKARWLKTYREVLTDIELRLLIEKEFKLVRLERTRDVFVFCCFTGLSYIDAKNLGEENIHSIGHKKWIRILLTKTKVQSTIPLLPIVEQILNKYRASPNKQIGQRLLPVLSNQKMNQYLKEISEICHINKRMTFHLSRHTFATTVTLSNGVPIESVSKMLGHQSMRTTQIYAQVLDHKLSKDMELVAGRY
ncbi:site-specific integrase [Croceitalea rosinachiae]|uniref:Site-specific integrase n=1 Tax=Croceitalea rosinachiae TaxID=3075596 RepID=A0ABU3A922_9FLAO|nr:site-specific integrase [Croceitalea sp. F388]MDT0606305.1 site-specific integrase [Croceitalea sp. F388]